MSEETTLVVKAKPCRKIFKANKITKIPDNIINNSKLNEYIKQLPLNYNFELPKTIWRIQELNVNNVALQMPEGLLAFATTIADILEEFTGANVIIMGDVTYGACCIDDFTATALRIQLLIHYGHSCLIPIDKTCNIKVLYIFVDIKIDPLHLMDIIKLNFSIIDKLCLVSTIQFVATIQNVANQLVENEYDVIVPQIKPLSPGEILGCTAPTLIDKRNIIYVGDGRFHLEAIMIANPNLKSYKYDPYSKEFTEEFYNHKKMEDNRQLVIEKSLSSQTYGIILGTIGRQGHPKIVKIIKERLKLLGKIGVVILLSEIYPNKMGLFDLDCFVQVACPRLSIDWGLAFNKPFLTPYEFFISINDAKWHGNNSNYPMDFYAFDSIGPWTPNHKPKQSSTKCCGKCTQ